MRVFDDSTRSMLKQFKGHTGAVRVSLFAPNKTTVMSGGDDGTVRGWDMPTGAQLFSHKVHSEQVRSGVIGSATPDVWMTGGYDKKVAAFDTRTKAVSFALHTSEPVECITMVDSYLFAAANGPAVDLYDLRNTERAIIALSNHAKTVTCMDTSENGAKLLTGSADQTVKLWNLSQSKFQVSFSLMFIFFLCVFAPGGACVDRV